MAGNFLKSKLPLLKSHLFILIIKLKDNGAIHKWYAVLLDSYAGLQGVKERVRQCKTVKEHMMVNIYVNYNLRKK